TLVAAFPLFAVLYLEPQTALWHILIALIVLAFTTIFFTVNWIGGGDVKLMTGAALWAGPRHIAMFLLATSALGFLIALVLLGLRSYGNLIAAVLPDNSLLRRLQALAQDGQCPYGAAIGVAGIVAVHRIFLQ